MGQARVWIRPQRGFGSRAWGAARAFQTAGGPAGEDHACLLSPCWLQPALGQASGNPRGGAPSTQPSSGKGPHLLQALPSPQAPAICSLWSLESCYNFSDFSLPLNPWRKTPFLLGRPSQSSFMSSMVINIYVYIFFASYTSLFIRASLVAQW